MFTLALSHVMLTILLLIIGDVMKSWKILLLILFLTGCATAYQPMGGTGGFYHRMVSENAYIIGFSGNAFTDSQKANDFAKLRAAEIGSKLGFTHFVIAGTLDKSRTEIINSGSTTTTSGNVSSFGNTAYFSGTSTTTDNSMPVYKPGVEIGVLYSDGLPEGRHLEIFHIETFMAEIKNKYNLKF